MKPCAKNSFMFLGLRVLTLGWAKIVMREPIKKYEDRCHNWMFLKMGNENIFSLNGMKLHIHVSSNKACVYKSILLIFI